MKMALDDADLSSRTLEAMAQANIRELNSVKCKERTTESLCNHRKTNKHFTLNCSLSKCYCRSYTKVLTIFFQSYVSTKGFVLTLFVCETLLSEYISLHFVFAFSFQDAQPGLPSVTPMKKKKKKTFIKPVQIHYSTWQYVIVNWFWQNY